MPTMVAVFLVSAMVGWDGHAGMRQERQAVPHAEDMAASDLTARWDGTWDSDKFTVAGMLTTLLAQSETTLSGEVTITGTACLMGGAVSGTVDGDTVVFGVVFAGDAQANFVGTVLDDGATLEGTYEVSGGTCAEDSGTWRVAKVALPCDVDADGIITLADALALIGFLRHGGESLPGYPDCNNDRVLDIRDVIAILRTTWHSEESRWRQASPRFRVGVASTPVGAGPDRPAS
jgi:hypothetical protein